MANSPSDRTLRYLLILSLIQRSSFPCTAPSDLTSGTNRQRKTFNINTESAIYEFDVPLPNQS